MNRFLLKLSIFSIFPLATLYGVFLLENGKADPYYLRLTTPKQESLILGNSKAAQGILPIILNEDLKDIFESKIYNYSFSLSISPYGPTYLESIKRKLISNQTKKKSYFILTVDPWSISSIKIDPDNPDKFKEKDSFLNFIKNVDEPPNLNYLLKWFMNSYYEIILRRFIDKISILNKDGWFQEREIFENQMELKKRKENMINYYNNLSNEYSHSKTRYNYLIQTIEFLSERGEVILIRMPIHDDILFIENKLDTDFNLRMIWLKERYGIKYYDFNNFNDVELNFNDGVHLDKKSALIFSKCLASFISENKIAL